MSPLDHHHSYYPRGGGWYAYPRYGYPGIGGLLILVLIIFLILYLLGGVRF